MERVDSMIGSDSQTEIDNDDDVQVTSTEEEVFENIKNVLKIEVPLFFYWPSGIEYRDYTVDVDSQTAILQYANDSDVLHFMIIANAKNASLFAMSDSGKLIKEINSELMNGVDLSLWEVFEEGDEQPTYILQWEYKNVYYELSGKILETEMENIANNIMY